MRTWRTLTAGAAALGLGAVFWPAVVGGAAFVVAGAVSAETGAGVFWCTRPQATRSAARLATIAPILAPAFFLRFTNASTDRMPDGVRT